ncbi:hypothetical protein An02g01780 [Aspergillus niger]|uniref:Uncharacterized protein n=2 Tax=Aspergillus niger TaxID=5061 RepID=A2QBZ9_ASPNC|nr:hypothetical protein An02g01780 [Aspergillus niger]CAK37480.1 hypothetical protein An02g01780 [Aspergillus niger]
MESFEMSNDGNLRQEEGPALWMRSWPVSREFLSCSRSENGPGGRSRPGKIFGRELGIPVHSRGGREPGRRGVKGGGIRDSFGDSNGRRDPVRKVARSLALSLSLARSGLCARAVSLSLLQSLFPNSFSVSALDGTVWVPVPYWYRYRRYSTSYFCPPVSLLRLALLNAYYSVIILIAGISFSGGTIVRFQGFSACSPSLLTDPFPLTIVYSLWIIHQPRLLCTIWAIPPDMLIPPQAYADSSEVPQQIAWTKGAGKKQQQPRGLLQLPLSPNSHLGRVGSNQALVLSAVSAVSPSFILPVPPARKLRIGYHLMRRHALHTLGPSDPGGLIGGEHTDVTELNHNHSAGHQILEWLEGPTMKAKGIQTDLRVRDDVCGPGPRYLHGTCFTPRTLPTAEEPWRGGKGKTNSGLRNFPVAIGSGRDNAAAICRGADPEILASTSRDAADDAWTLGGSASSTLTVCHIPITLSTHDMDKISSSED